MSTGKKRSKNFGPLHHKRVYVELMREENEKLSSLDETMNGPNIACHTSSLQIYTHDLLL